MSEHFNASNMADYITYKATIHPHKRAVVATHKTDASNRTSYISLTFKQLDNEINAYARAFLKIGIKKFTKTVVMLKPGLEFYITFFALCKIGATMVIVDPGIGLNSLKKCIEEAEPEAFIGVTLAHALRTLFRWSSKTIKILVTKGTRLFWGGYSFYKIRDKDITQLTSEVILPDEMSAIMFTSGSTGISKGVVYTQKMFVNQVKYIQQMYGFSPEDVDLATFPLFGLIDVCLGMTAVIPDMDATKPAKANPKKLISAIEDNGATVMFGSPALLDTFSRYGSEKNIKLPSLKKVISCGAPARNDILRRFHLMLDEQAQIYTPYGATESLPISSIGSQTLLEETASETDQGGGTCVGYKVDELDVKIIKITDDPIESWSEDLEIPQGQIGEIVVKGSIVSKEYYRRPQNTILSKITDGNDTWHRMGDIGRIDTKGRLWFCGRKSHRVVSGDTTFFSIPVERIFNQHSNVYRTALVGVRDKNNQLPVICVELEKGIKDLDIESLINDLKKIAENHEHTKEIKHFIIHPGFPVDIRHNAKINRETLSEWASYKLKDRL